MRALSQDSRRIAVADLSIDSTRSPIGLVTRDLDIGSEAATGEDRAPLSNWGVIMQGRGSPPGSPRAWLERFRPRHAQLFVLILVGFGTERGDWRGWVIHRGKSHPLSGFQVVGAKCFQVGTPGVHVEHSGSVQNRWSRVKGVLGGAFDKLRQGSVALVGCSRSGTIAATTLAALGVRHLSLIDGDVVEPHNLDGMYLATEDDVGRNKAAVLAERLIAYRPDIALSVVPQSLTMHNVTSVGRADVIVSCVDQDVARLRIAQFANDFLRSHLDIATGVRLQGGAKQLAADVRLLLPGEGCISCIGGLASRETAQAELLAPSSVWTRSALQPWNREGRIGSSLLLNSVAVSTGIQSILEVLESGEGASTWHRIRWEADCWTIDMAKATSQRQCEICRRR